jgi:predicted site-specific integrase-resolvase
MSHTKKRVKRLLGYCRVSTEAQDLNRQRQALKAYGCKLVFEDKASGKSLAGRPQLARVRTSCDREIPWCWQNGIEPRAACGTACTL